eukprot:TRINITY_DN12502_c0_g1_i3.p1 TRINITY_DN12502_c0_g1~~TRINITY_DN12502_c0_g1_i3.p1  ORF type:complete len:589 (+),score=120.16 TRINITY_DN12502_c0_g1_i3:178-1944(+)
MVFWRRGKNGKKESEEAEPLLNGTGQDVEVAVKHKELKQRSTLFAVTPFILGNEFCERLAFYGLATNLQVYFTQVLGIAPATAATQIGAFSGTCYITPILGAYLADSYWGRYVTIIVFSAIYLMGLFWLVLTTIIPGLVPPENQTATNLQYGALLIALYTIAVGTGGIKANVSAFGADQFDERNPQDVREKASFFNWFYFAINVGSFIASTVVVYVQESISWTIGYLIPAVALAIALVLFLSGSSMYKHVPTAESPISRVFKVMWAQCRGKGNGFSKKQIQEVKAVLRLFPMFFSCIVYWACYSTMGTLFVEQGTQMNQNITLFGATIKVPAASMSMVDTIAIIVLVPLYDNVLLGTLKKYGRRITHMQRIGWGYFVGMLAMLSAAVIEQFRRKEIDDGNFTLVEGRYSIHVSGMSLFYIGIPYWVIGTSEILASIGQLEFFYDQAPYTMRSFCMAMQLVSTALGSYLYSFLVYAANKITSTQWWINNGNGRWLPPDLYQGHLDQFYLLIAALALINLFVFFAIAKLYPSEDKKQSGKEQEGQEEEDEEFHEIAEPISIVSAGKAVDERFSRSIAYHAETPPLPPTFR